MAKAKVVPINEAGSHRTGTLVRVSKKRVDEVLGFKPNVPDDETKVKYSWGFKYRGHKCGIWDYYGSWRNEEFSTFGPKEVFEELFGTEHVER